MFSPARPRLRRALVAAFAVCTAVAVLSGCAKTDAGTTSDGKTVVRYQGTTGQVEAYELAADLGYFTKIQLKWEGGHHQRPGQRLPRAAWRCGGRFRAGHRAGHALAAGHPAR